MRYCSLELFFAREFCLYAKSNFCAELVSRSKGNNERRFFIGL